MSLPRWLERIFSHYQIPFQEHNHLPVHSANQLAHAEHFTGHRVAKPVFLSWQGRPVTVILPASARLDMGRVEDVLGVRGTRMASEEEIARWFKGCPPGCVPPVRIRSDQIMVMDRSLAHLGKILFSAGDPELAVSMPFRAWFRMVRPGVGRFAYRDGQPCQPHLVLVVEDEPDTNYLLCRLLEDRGYLCRGVVDGEGALALARKLRPSAILLDLMLPDMSGFDMYERLRKMGPLKLPPALVVTALDDDAIRQRGLDMGADAYLTKPFFPESLMRELNEVLADACA